MRKIHARHVVLGLLGLVALYGLVGAFVAPPIAKRMIAKELGERLGRTVVIDDVAANPYTLEASVRGFRILEPDNRTVFVAFDHLDLDGSAMSFYRLAPVVDEVVLEGLKVNLVRDGETHYNLSDILARLARPKAKKEKEETPRFSLGNIRVRHASVSFDDRPKQAKHQVADIDIAIPFVSNLPTHLREFVQPRFSAKVNGSEMRLTGETLPFENSLRTHLAVDLAGVDIKRYVEYSPSPLPVKVDGGNLDAHISVRFVQAAGKDPSVDVAGTLALHDVALSTPDAPLAKLANADIKIDSFDPLAGVARVGAIALRGLDAFGDDIHVASAEAKDIGAELATHRVHVATVALDDGTVALTRRADGSIEIPIRTGKAAAPSEPADPMVEGRADIKWLVEIGKLAAANYRIAVTDESVKPKAVHKVVLARLDASDISSARGAKMTLAAKLAADKGGAVDLDGTVAVDPLEVTARIDARHLDLMPYRAYAAHFQTVALKSGFASAKGTVTVRGEGKALRLAYNGGAAITRIATTETTSGEDLVNWESVKVSGIEFKWSQEDPLDLAIADIAVDRIYSRVVVTPEGKINLQQLKFATPEDPKAQDAPSGPPKARNIRVDRITFTGSRLDFTDHFIKPNYGADVGELGGTVTNLSSDPQTRGVVDLKGSWDQSSPVIIAGTINPLSGNLFLDLGAKGKDIDLTKLSAYSARYAGYGIKEGKLTLDVKYHVEDGKLQGRNNIFLDQLAFGDKVESPEATKLPVLFAVNLLKDADGHINLELPISGSLEDPKFEFGAMVGAVVSSLLNKAVTSPFSLLTAALGSGGGNGSGNGHGDGATGGGDDLAYVEFDPGSDALGDKGERKLAALAKALKNRPAIKLEMASRADEDADVAALKRLALRRKLGEMKGGAITDEDYPRFVKIAFDKEAPKPKDSKEPPKETPPLEMEKFLLERVTLGKEELDQLAERRLEHVKQYLTATGQLPADRVLLASAADASQSSDPHGPRRVNFTLK